jgi:photosystem II stability/assembly factor-like uncharacterized protein
MIHKQVLICDQQKPVQFIFKRWTGGGANSQNKGVILVKQGFDLAKNSSNSFVRVGKSMIFYNSWFWGASIFVKNKTNEISECKTVPVIPDPVD